MPKRERKPKKKYVGKPGAMPSTKKGLTYWQSMVAHAKGNMKAAKAAYVGYRQRSGKLRKQGDIVAYQTSGKSRYHYPKNTGDHRTIAKSEDWEVEKKVPAARARLLAKSRPARKAAQQALVVSEKFKA